MWSRRDTFCQLLPTALIRGFLKLAILPLPPWPPMNTQGYLSRAHTTRGPGLKTTNSLFFQRQRDSEYQDDFVYAVTLTPHRETAWLAGANSERATDSQSSFCEIKGLGSWEAG